MQMERNDWSLAQRADTLRLSGAYEEAEGIFEYLHYQYENNAWVNAHLGANYCQIMDYEKAEKYLKQAIKKSKNYLWAYAQLGETYRLWAIVENREMTLVDDAIAHFKKALAIENLVDSISVAKCNYAWALAHLGATYRLKLVDFNKECTNQEIEKEALACLNRAIELIPTYAWAWGMRSTVYRLTQDYEHSFGDLGVEVVLAPNMEILQHASSPVPFLQSGRVNLYEHAWLAFYMTKKTSGEQRKIWYQRAIAFSKRALILQPGDLIADLFITVIEAHQKKEDGSLLQDYIESTSQYYFKKIKQKEETFFADSGLVFYEPCKIILRILISQDKLSVSYLEDLVKKLEELDKKDQLVRFILKDVISNPHPSVTNPKLWLWQNFALTETCANVIFLLSELKEILTEHSQAKLYIELAQKINNFFILEKTYQTPVLSKEKRSEILCSLCN